MDSYQSSSPKSIETYGKRLIDGSLRSVRGIREIPAKSLSTAQGLKTKSAFGFLLERYYYGINPPNDSAPDFPKAKVELKSTPLKRLKNGEFSAKERLVLNLINYNDEAKRNFSSSTFIKKNSQIMLIAYLHEKERAVVDYIVKIAELVALRKLSRADQIIIEQDWKKIVKKIKDGHADELSEGDTLYLGACTKAANSKVFRSAPGDIQAKPRAFSFKAGFMTTLMRGLMDAESAVKNVSELEDNDFESLIEKRFERFLGLTVAEIKNQVGKDLNSDAKGFFAQLARRMMGVRKSTVEEFEKADVIMKTVRLGKNGMPRESISFPYFSYMDIVKERWDEDEKGAGAPSLLKQELEKKFFFVVLQCGDDPNDIQSMWLKKVMFWNMPISDLDGDVRKVWRETVRRIKVGKADQLPKSTENRVSHVRPHARDSHDTIPTPRNGMQVKKCFWLNQSYIKDQVSNS